ncbi:aromatic ring-hydroxylating dioxygenase subunit alpha [Sneathiella chinensis]|uniref:Ring-hydroxylating oxygenase subunit alpha n=1 Tax=Sneathiella chinensis TaxID=349750 RepID=A0ABQ5U3V2_9PROT|nr:aromatic ring-hydroxylating dioxygenase subunit alpha [Sneathiella chinensis]GLQ05913.1 ring-hydroxylating oxygenase subunit alpha [Sneathiella chinensis]
MMSQEKNDELTRVGAGTPGGDMLRQYWMPAALTEELEQDRPVVPVNLLGEKLALFRNENDELVLMDRHCPHRGADMCFGRVEEGGIRCPFHGWKFDESGQCTEQPGEPNGSTMHKNIKINSYPVKEANGIIFAYLGSGEPPAFPAFDCFNAPESHVFSFKGLWECNWLQALEVGIDPAHASFLHRFLQDEDPKDSYGKQFRDTAADSEMPMTKVLREFPQPEIKVEDTDYGMRIIALRDLNNGSSHVRLTNQVFPCAITIPMSNEMTITQWHVPIDDENCYWFSMFTSFGQPVDKETMRAQRIKEHTLPEYAPIRNKRNDYGYNREEQETLTYTGMGLDINVHDQWACESMGPIQDRTNEHLGTTDKAIIQHRRKLRKAMAIVAEGGDRSQLPLHVDAEKAKEIKGPIAVDAIAPSEQWEEAWKERDAQRRAACEWDAKL